MIREVKSRDIEVLQHIWDVCFHDEPAYSQFFLRHYPHAKGFVFEENQQVVSILFLLPVLISSEKGYYVYACATLPEHQGKGFMKLLLEHVFQIAQDENMYGLFLIPGNNDLFDYYQRLDYQIFSFISETQFQCDGENVFSKKLKTSRDASKIYSIRQNFYTGLGDIQWSEKHIQFILELNIETLTIENEAYAFCEKDAISGKITILEWAIISENFESDHNDFFNALCCYFETNEIKIRSKIGKYREAAHPFSMVRLCFEKKIPENAYLNLGLD